MSLLFVLVPGSLLCLLFMLVVYRTNGLRSIFIILYVPLVRTSSYVDSISQFLLIGLGHYSSCQRIRLSITSSHHQIIQGTIKPQPEGEILVS